MCVLTRGARRLTNQPTQLICYNLHFSQALLAAGLLQYLPLKPRTTGLIGSITSAINCYMLLPAYPKQVSKSKEQ